MHKIVLAIQTILLVLVLGLSACDPLTLAGLALAYDKDDNTEKKALYNVGPYSKDGHPALFCAQLYENADNTCRLNELPFINTEFSTPSSKEIETRLLVSHQWMGDRFIQVLNNLPADILMLMRPITAIVIAENIRPSFYTTETGAIYLDPNYLWLNEEERDTISDEEDFRGNFDRDLNFASLWRYLTPEGSWSRLPNENRELSDITFPLARLLYHELAHANTFFPPASLSQISNNNTIIEAANQVIQYNLAFQLADFNPLQSNTLINLTKVMFQGETPTEFQKSLSASSIGSTFENDRATDVYGFVSFNGEVFFEDVALLFEELMAEHHFNQKREIAYTNSANSNFCNDYIIAWGQTGRIGDPKVKEAARLVATQILPDNNLGDAIDLLAAPEQTFISTDWCEPFRKEYNQRLQKSEVPEINIYEVDISENLRSPHNL